MADHEPAPAAEGMPSPEAVLEALKAVIDPEVLINVVDLGLIYGVEVVGRRIVAHYTLTTMGCALGPVIAGQITEVLSSFPADEVHAELTFRPPWTPDRISAEARTALGI